MRHKRCRFSARAISVPKQMEYRATNSISPNPRNARTHSEKQISQIAASIREFGFVGAIIVNRDGMILAGHGRYMAAKLLNLKTVPTITLDYLTKAQQRAYILPHTT